MGVADGQAVNAAVTNGALASKFFNNTFVGIQTLNHPTSGGMISNVQQTLNDMLALNGTQDTRLDAIEATLPLKADLVGGKVPSAQLPAIAITDVFVVADIAARDALPIGSGDGEVQEGDVAVVLDGDGLGNRLSFIYSGSAWELLTAGTVISVNGFEGIVVLALNDIDDVNITAVANRQILKYNSGSVEWENEDLYSSADDAATGSNATLATVDTSAVRLTNASLVSIDMIPAGYSAQPFTLKNRTGVILTINNETGATAANRILTGTGSNLSLAINASLNLCYDSTSMRWLCVGGSGAGGNVTGPVSSTDNAIARYNGTGGTVIQDSLVQVTDDGAISSPEIATPSAPAANRVLLYPKSNGYHYGQDDAGREYLLGQMPQRNSTTSGNATVNDHTIIFSSTAHTLTLPDLTLLDGQEYELIHEGTNFVEYTIAAFGGQTIYGGASIKMFTTNEKLKIKADTANLNWRVVDHYATSLPDATYNPATTNFTISSGLEAIAWREGRYACHVLSFIMGSVSVGLIAEMEIWGGQTIADYTTDQFVGEAEQDSASAAADINILGMAGNDYVNFANGSAAVVNKTAPANADDCFVTGERIIMKFRVPIVDWLP